MTAQWTRHKPIALELVTIPPVLAALFILFAWRDLTGETNIATFVDNTHLLLPVFSYISRVFSGGEYPYWMNSLAGGLPLYNHPQFGVTYPFYFFSWGLYATPLDAAIHVHYVTL